MAVSLPEGEEASWLPLSEPSVARRLQRIRQFTGQGMYRLGALLRCLGVGLQIDQGRADHDSVGETTDTRRLLCGTDTETDRDGNLGVLTDMAHFGLDLLGSRCRATGHAIAGDVVEEA